jgi:hypothetical protein
MTSWKLDQFCAQPVSGYPLCPLPANQAVLAAYHGNTRDRRELGQRKRQSGRIPSLRTSPRGGGREPGSAGRAAARKALRHNGSATPCAAHCRYTTRN